MELSPEFNLVIGVAGLSWLVHHIWMSVAVGSARKKYGVNYPDLYASECEWGGLLALACGREWWQNP